MARTIVVTIIIAIATLTTLAECIDYPQCSVQREVVPQKRGNDRLSNKGLIALYDTAFFFLDDILHSADLRYMSERGVDFSDPDNIGDWFTDWDTWVEYWVGYAIMVSLGIVLIFSVTIGAFVTCCCRCCCNNCGAKRRPQRNGDRSCRIGCGISLLIIMILCMFGGICILLTTLDMMDKIDARKENSVYNNYADSFDQLQVYLDDSINEVNCTSVGSFSVTKASVFVSLDGVVDGSFQQIEDRTLTVETIESLLDFTGRLSPLQNHLTEGGTISSSLETNAASLDTALTAARATADGQLQSCATEQECIDMTDKLLSLTVQPDYTIFDFITAATMTQRLSDENVDGELRNGLGEYNGAKQTLSDDVQPSIDNAKAQIDDIDNEIIAFMDDLNSTLAGADLSSLGQSLRDLEDDVPGWIWDTVLACFATMGSIVLLISLLTFIGLIHGVACSQPYSEGDRCDTTVQAANWLTAAVTFIFIFYWIFMIVCTALFIGGGIAHNDACRHIVNLNDSAITPILDDIVNQYIEELGADMSEIYTACGKNTAVYTAIGADNIAGLNISELLDLTLLRDEIELIKNINIDLGVVELLDDPTASLLRTSEVPFTDLLTAINTDYDAELNKPILNENIGDIIAELQSIENRNLPGVDLNQAIAEFQAISDDIDVMQDEVAELKLVLPQISDILNLVHFNEAVDQLEDGEQYLNTEANTDIETYVGVTADDVYDDFTDLTAYIDASIRQNVSRCYPAYDSLVILIESTCVDVIYPVNGLWLAFGYTLFLYIPAIFILFKLINLYKVYESDYDDDDDSDNGFEDDYAKEIVAAKTAKAAYDSERNDTEMKAMNNPVFISDEGLRNGYGETPLYNGLHTYPGYGSDQSLNHQGTLPGVQYTSLSGNVNQAYYEQENIPKGRYRDDDDLSYEPDYPSRENAVNDHLNVSYSESPKPDYNEEKKEKRNSYLKLGVPVFPMAAPPKYDDIESPYRLPRPRPRKATQV